MSDKIIIYQKSDSLLVPNLKEPLHLLLEVSEFLRQICAFMGFYAAQNGNSVPAFRDNPSVPSSTIKQVQDFVWWNQVLSRAYTIITTVITVYEKQVTNVF